MRLAKSASGRFEQQTYADGREVHLHALQPIDD